MQAGLHAILTCGPVQTSFQVDIEIYEDKLGQSGDRILSSHITKQIKKKKVKWKFELQKKYINLYVICVTSIKIPFGSDNYDLHHLLLQLFCVFFKMF